MSENNGMAVGRDKMVKTIYSFKIQDGSKERVFGILKPTRKMKQDGDLFYASTLSKFISAGVLPKALFDKILKNNGGTASDPEKEEYSRLYRELVKLNEEFVSVISENKKDEERTQEEKDRESEIKGEMIRLRRAMQDLESEQNSVYENTAEAKARNQSVLWWFFSLAAEVFDGGKKISHLFDPVLSHDEKLDKFDEILESEETFLKPIYSRLNYLTTVWFLNAASSVEDFEHFDKEYLEGDKISTVDVEDGGGADEVKEPHVETDKTIDQDTPQEEEVKSGE